MRRLPVIAVLLLLTGCAALKPEFKGPVPEIHSIKASAVLLLEEGESSLKGRASIAARKPGFFRIEVLGPFGQRLALLSSNGTSLAVFSEGNLRYYSWEDPALPFSFTAEELVSYLLGSVPRDLENHEYEVETLPGSINTKVSRDGLPSYSVLLSDFKAVQGLALPFSISIEDQKRRMSVRYSDVSVNPPLGEEVFTVDFR